MKAQDIDSLARIIWDYHHLNQTIIKSDAIVCLCSHDTNVANRAADLYLQGYASKIVFSGGFGALTKDIFDKPEAVIFAEIAVAKGVPKEHILTETQSTNTGENIRFTHRLLKDKLPKSIILVQKPYMERRTYATFKKQWPEKVTDFSVTSPQISYDDYCSASISEDTVINIMVGDLQRICEYPKLGFQIPQDIPVDVWSAYLQLIDAGYTKHLLQ